MTNQIMLTLAVLAPCGISAAPMTNATKPIPSRNKPSANLIGPDGFIGEPESFTHIQEKNGASEIMKNELSVPNQLAGTSRFSL